jgi:hypothetical protein
MPEETTDDSRVVAVKVTLSLTLQINDPKGEMSNKDIEELVRDSLHISSNRTRPALLEMFRDEILVEYQYD